MRRYGLLLMLPLLNPYIGIENVKELPSKLLYQLPAAANATITDYMEPRYAALVGDRVTYINDTESERMSKTEKQIYEETRVH